MVGAAGQPSYKRPSLLASLPLTYDGRTQLMVGAPAAGVPQAAQQAQARRLEQLGHTCSSGARAQALGEGCTQLALR